eukprot:TRINITY_DN48651_c0_g1_i1.p1 TRINITY_DN48651_c0_g1~~TRINITY_DN48651_c0_g1_i1.p1  ORF type:complete len:144 (+),score=23.41 TRINITY_DN48651_c0_g1_i1:80-511(+)
MSWVDDYLILGQTDRSEAAVYAHHDDLDESEAVSIPKGSIVSPVSELQGTSFFTPKSVSASDPPGSPLGRPPSLLSEPFPLARPGLVRGTNGRLYCQDQVKIYLAAWGSKRVMRYIRNHTEVPPPGVTCPCKQCSRCDNADRV